MDKISKKNKIILLVVLIILLVGIFVAAYAFFGSFTQNIENKLNVNIVIDESYNSTFISDATNIYLEVPTRKMSQYSIGTESDDYALLNATLTSGSDDLRITCTYDIYFEYDQSSNVYGIAPTPVTTGVGDSMELGFGIWPNDDYPFAITGTSDFFDFNKNFNYDTSDGWIAASGSSGAKRLIVEGAQISDASTTGTTQSWMAGFDFINLDLDQNALAGKSFSGYIYIDNVSCSSGLNIDYLADYIIDNYEDLNGTDEVSNSPWSVVHQMVDSTYDAGYRYVGKNPDNYVLFNNELWRIIGVMDTEYCTDSNELCTSTDHAPLVKIIRNDSIGSMPWDYKQNGVGSSNNNNYGSNDWSDSQLMMLLNEPKYYHNGYNLNTQLHTGYVLSELTNENTVSDGTRVIYKNMGAYFDNDLTPYTPASTPTTGFTSTAEVTKCANESSTSCMRVLSSSAQNMIQAVKWDLYGIRTNNDATNNTPIGYYKVERNIDGLGELPDGGTTRPTYWFGKVGLMYSSDFGFSTNGNNSDSGDYSREGCISYQMYGWNSGDYNTYCAGNDWLRYINFQGVDMNDGTNQWFISLTKAYTYTVRYLANYRVAAGRANSSYTVRPTLYLKANVGITGGSGTYDDPYTLAM